jgi:hypothetical protein
MALMGSDFNIEFLSLTSPFFSGKNLRSEILSREVSSLFVLEIVYLWGSAELSVTGLSSDFVREEKGHHYTATNVVDRLSEAIK